MATIQIQETVFCTYQTILVEWNEINLFQTSSPVVTNNSFSEFYGKWGLLNICNIWCLLVQWLLVGKPFFNQFSLWAGSWLKNTKCLFIFRWQLYSKSVFAISRGNTDKWGTESYEGNCMTQMFSIFWLIRPQLGPVDEVCVMWFFCFWEATVFD